MVSFRASPPDFPPRPGGPSQRLPSLISGSNDMRPPPLGGVPLEESFDNTPPTGGVLPNGCPSGQPLSGEGGKHRKNDQPSSNLGLTLLEHGLKRVNLKSCPQGAHVFSRPTREGSKMACPLTCFHQSFDNLLQLD
ncbi:hypothetical protein RRG08_000227 [Elysia crispata]|uniref:Uncharacterized protein n=1 Tax=Elysia crispata TaxID=231223 RepID=A0AAE1AWN1_9GAST|nr:hypothetical protein RRG08_000227 [Elysia crispata]